MTDAAAARPRLQREMGVLGTYLSGREPSPRVRAAYAAYHATKDITGGRGTSRFDRLLLGLVRTGRIGARLGDVYTSRFCRHGVLRRKMVLALALLEAAPPTYEVFDRPSGGGRAVFWCRAVLRGVSEGVTLVIAAVLLLPLHGLFTLAPGRRSGELR